MRQVFNCPGHTNVLSSTSSHRVVHENESLEQQRANLRRALAAAEQSVQRFPRGSSTHRKVKARVGALQRAGGLSFRRRGDQRSEGAACSVFSFAKEPSPGESYVGLT